MNNDADKSRGRGSSDRKSPASARFDLFRPLMLIAVAAVLIAMIAAAYLLRPEWFGGRKPLVRVTTGPEAGYVGSDSCRECHKELFDSFQKVGMGHSAFVLTQANMIEDLTTNTEYFHKPSNQHYKMTWEDGKLYQTRRQLGPDNQPINELKVRADYVIGSGNHARSYVHSAADGQLYLMPINWYSQEKAWGMNPGYDRSVHPGFSRRITYDCAFCHTGYPEIPKGADRYNYEETSVFPKGIETINCERCHGPGEKHVQLATKTNDSKKISGSIVNPAKLSPDLQMDVCMQCHLETTSAKLPRAVQREGRQYFSYRPGEKLTDYAIAFDHPKGTGHADKFEIASQGYRLRQAKCFIESKGKMTCTTCHDPHKVPEDRVRYQINNCLKCHDVSAHPDPQKGKLAGCSLDPAKRAIEKDNCITCHMPSRRTEDVIHVVMTDHNIMRHKPEGDLLAPLPEHDFRSYKGDVALYYPETLPSDEANLYLGVAHVTDAANVPRGVDLLNAFIARNEKNFTAHLLRGVGLKALGQIAPALQDLQAAAKLQPDHAGAQAAVADAHVQLKDLKSSIKYDEEAVKLQPTRASSWARLAASKAAQGDNAGAEKDFKTAIEKDPFSAEHHFVYADFLMGLGRVPDAEQQVKAGLAVNPGDNRGNQMYAGLLAQQKRFALSAWHVVQAIRFEVWPAPLFGRFVDVLTQAPMGERSAILQNAVKELPLEGRILHAGWLSRNGNVPAAAEQLRLAIDAESSSTAGFLEAGKLAAAIGQLDVAQRLFTRAMNLSPADEDTVIRLADGMRKENNSRGAEAFLRAEITSAPENARMINSLALLKATAPDPMVRNGLEAEKLARRAIEIMGKPNFILLDSLAAALAEQERFEEAAEEAQRALEMARLAGSMPYATEIEKRLKAYEAGKKPFEEPPPKQ